YRVTALPASDLYPGCTTEIGILVDHSRFPYTPPPDPNRRLQALSFGLALPAPLQYAGYTFDGTYLKQQLGGNPDFAAVQAVAGGVTVGMVLDMELINALPEGLNQSVIKIRVTIPAGTAPQNILVTPVATLGNPVVPLELVMPIGSVSPVGRRGTVHVVSGTCAIQSLRGWIPAAAGMLQETTGSEKDGDTTDDSKSPTHYTDSDWDISDPASLPFEEPSEDDFVTLPSDDTAALVAGDDATLLLGAEGAGAAEAGDCDISTRITPVHPGLIECGASDVDAIDDNETEYIVSVRENARVETVRVTMELEHPNVSDLSFTLEHAGTTVTLCDFCIINPPSDGVVRVVWSDDAVAPPVVDHGCRCRVPLDNSDDTALADFVDASTDPPSSAGDWTLTITDGTTMPNDPGTLLSWCVQINVPEHPSLDPGLTLANLDDGAIPSGSPGSTSPLERTVAVPTTEGQPIFDIKVTTDIDHLDPDDLRIRLTSPMGTVVVLYDNGTFADPSPDNLLVTWASDGIERTALTDTECGCRVLSEAALSAFDGEASAGTWTLDLLDEAVNGVSGTLAEWYLHVNVPNVTRVVEATASAPSYAPVYATLSAALVEASGAGTTSPTGIEVIEVRAAATGSELLETNEIGADAYFGRLLWLHATASPSADSGVTITAPAPPAAVEPLLSVTGTGGADSWVVIGGVRHPADVAADPDPATGSPDITGWRGFRVTESAVGLAIVPGAGISIAGLPADFTNTVPEPGLITSISVAGNVVTGNGDFGGAAPANGGGIGAENCRDLFLYQNEVELNASVAGGAGVYLDDSSTLVAENWIHDNGFPDVTGASALGGGLLAGGGVSRICRNRVYKNSGREGAGVFVFLESPTGFAHAEEP
ncbi:MAG: proprotein convertase P-domain-containing protein, partial [Actinobacteria bacterium]|nr:proprotein convertase P-domain-containing protein [Actinomycetota bacterium]